MHQFSFKHRKEMLIPQTDVFRPPLDENGNKLSGDDLIRRMCKAADAYKEKYGKAVPVDPRFMQWLYQTKDKLSEGMTSEAIFATTISETIGVF